MKERVYSVYCHTKSQFSKIIHTKYSMTFVNKFYCASVKKKFIDFHPIKKTKFFFFTYSYVIAFRKLINCNKNTQS